MKIKYVGIIVISAVAALIGAPMEIAASGHGSGSGMRGPGLHTFHFGKNFRHAQNRRNFNNQATWYGGYGYYAVPPYDYDNSGSGSAQPSNVVYVLPSPTVHSCRYAKETVTVPSESGGTREITVTRC
jgi:hypothetical protein